LHGSPGAGPFEDLVGLAAAPTARIALVDAALSGLDHDEVPELFPAPGQDPGEKRQRPLV
jgi:hypothetical protein